MIRLKKIKRHMIKGAFFIALLVGLPCVLYVRTSAATVNDLRELIGDRRITDETLIEDMRAIIYKYKKSQYKKDLVTLLEKMGDFGYGDKLDNLLNDKELTLQALEQNFKENKDVTTIIRYMNDAISVLDQLGALNKPDTYVLDLLTEEEGEEAFLYANSILNTKDDTYDIGLIGEGLLPPTNQYFILQKAFGTIVYAGKSAMIEKNTGIDMLIKPKINEDSYTEVISQFHGVVKNIEEEKENQYKVTISHGDSLITTYEYLCDLKVKIGQKVKQYDILGKPSNETFHFEVILNTIPINPLYLYGTVGVEAYKTWYVTHPGMNLEKIDFSNVKKTIIPVSEDENILVDSTVQEDSSSVVEKIKIEENYVKPETPSIQSLDVKE